MDEQVYNIKHDEYEPDLFNDMSVQEEITVGSSENIINSYQTTNLDQEYVTNPSVNMLTTSGISHQPTEIKNKAKIIYLKQSSGNIQNPVIKGLRLGQNLKQVKVIPLKLASDPNTRYIFNPSSGGNITRLINPSSIRNGIQVTKLNNVNLTKVQHGQKILIANRPALYKNVTPIVNVTSSVSFSQPNTIIQPLTANHSNQTALKLEPGDSGFYNLTGGNGPTRYYPRMHSPDKDSLDGSQEMANIYKTNGLRKYARSVCDKVKEKGTTTYSEVADELVHEYAAEHPMIPATQLHYIQKNIRRRVYDALNVLMALKVLEKEKKEIKWKGLPVNLLEECKQLEEEKNKKSEQLQTKVEELSELVLQLISYKNLVGRNRQREKEGSAPPLNERIKLPFLVITTSNNTVIDCNISPEKLEYLFTFDQPFEMQDEFQTLKQSGFTLRLGTTQCTESQYKRCLELVPNTLRFYVEAIYQQRSAVVPDFMSLHRRNLAAQVQSRSTTKNTQSSSVVTGGQNIIGGGSQGYKVTGGSSSNNLYWSEGQDSPPLIHHHNKQYSPQKRFGQLSVGGSTSDGWGNVGDSSYPKYRLTTNPSHNFGVGSNQSNSFNKQFLNNPPHELEDEIEVMDEEADFPSD